MGRQLEWMAAYLHALGRFTKKQRNTVAQTTRKLYHKTQLMQNLQQWHSCRQARNCMAETVAFLL